MRLMRLTYLVCLLLVTQYLMAQPFGNEWINYGQKYYKIKIAKDGLYRIDSTALANAGLPLATLNPQNLQLFHKGQEIYPYVFGEADGKFNSGDFILFYAEKNKGRDDSMYYDKPLYLTNPFYSVINDTSAVFITWNSSTTNNRLTLETDTAYSTYNPSPYYMKESFTGKDAGYSGGPLNFLSLEDPRYKTGEGFIFAQIDQGTSAGLSVNTSAIYTAGPPLSMAICISGANDISAINPDHLLETYYTDNLGNNIVLGGDSINAYDNSLTSYTINPSLLGGNTMLGCRSLINSQTTISNYTSINYIRAVYPQQFNLMGNSQEIMSIPNDGQAKSKLVISNFGGSKPVLVNISDKLLQTVTASGGNFLTLIPNGAQNKMCYLTDTTNIISVTSIKAVSATAQFADYSSQVADSNYIIVYKSTLDANGDVTAYKNYRSSPVGGSYPVIMASVDELYNQFGYGIEVSPMAIRNFCAMVINAAGKDPAALLLMGKGIHSPDCVKGGNPGKYKAKNLVPTWGYPSADNLITQGLPGSSYLEPAIPTGRIAAQTANEVAEYLAKVQLYEQQTDDSLWKKHALHFVGGNDAGEQFTLGSYMNVMAKAFEDTLMGGNVYSFYKTSNSLGPFPVTTSDSIKRIIEDGVLMMTFFAHGSQTGFEQNIDEPQNYNNAPHFPLIIANSCYTGDIHSGDQLSHSEVYTLAPNLHGCIGYLATVSTGVADKLFYYSHEFYKHIAAKGYGESYGINIKNTIRKLMYDQVMGAYPGDSLLKSTVMEITFHGDPMVAPYATPKPDYAITNSDIILDNKTWQDSVGIKIIMTNNGRAIKDSFVVMIQRNFPNGDTLKIFKKVKAPYYKDTLSFFIAEEYNKAVGINCFSVELDYLHLISELSELNNKTSGNVCLFIPGADIEPVWPYKFAIMPDLSNVTLKASTADPFAAMNTYRFQVDTNDKFLAPFVNTTVSAPGGVVSLPVSLYNTDSIVYYWRVCRDDNDTLNWKESSFQVINKKYGWGQAHFHQFKNDAYQYVVYSDSVPRLFKFVNDVKTIQVNDMAVGTWDPYGWMKVQFFYNNAQQRLWACEQNGFSVALFDTITGNILRSDTLGGASPCWGWVGQNGNFVCQTGVDATYDFGSVYGCSSFDGVWRQNMANFILDSIPNNTPVLIYQIKCLYCTPPDSLAPLINAFHSIGSTYIDSLKYNDSTVLIVFGRKGWAPGMAHEVRSSSPAELITLKDSINTKFRNGFIASPIIGPCMYSDTAWKSLHWYYTNLESSSADSIVIRLIGINAQGQKFVLGNFPDSMLNVLDLSSYVDGTVFPYIQLIAYQADNVLNTPPQLQRWQIIYDPAPEAAIHPPAGFQVFKSKVAEGEDYKVRLPIKNISEFTFTDSLVVTYVQEDPSRIMHTLPYSLKNKPFMPDSVIFDTITVSTLGYAGGNTLWVDVNPPGHAKYQPEQFHFNNVAQIDFDVDRDKINPLLDVTFDGIHILNGDIVSAKPDVLVSLKDENKFLALNDTSNFTVYLQNPGSVTETRLYFKDVLQFTPAQLPNNSCKINYHPALLQDGVYSLHIRATDRSSNASGQIDYRIQFEIVNKPSITEVLNYPNPFSTSTRFVFTITGSEVPETFKVQVLTVTGRLVKEITRDELGFLHIGRNITEYAWDGTDMFGDKLANGVYLYRVETRLNGDEIEHLNTAADGYFKKGYGKMLLMR